MQYDVFKKDITMRPIGISLLLLATTVLLAACGPGPTLATLTPDHTGQMLAASTFRNDRLTTQTSSEAHKAFQSQAKSNMQHIFVTYSGSGLGSVEEFTLTEKLVAIATAGINTPYGITFDKAGKMFAVNSGNNTITTYKNMILLTTMF